MDSSISSFHPNQYKGNGKINALMTIAYTENFTSFTNPRSYAVYVGVVPFDHSSGTQKLFNMNIKPIKTE